MSSREVLLFAHAAVDQAIGVNEAIQNSALGGTDIGRTAVTAAFESAGKQISTLAQTHEEQLFLCIAAYQTAGEKINELETVKATLVKHNLPVGEELQQQIAAAKESLSEDNKKLVGFMLINGLYSRAAEISYRPSTDSDTVIAPLLQEVTIEESAKALAIKETAEPLPTMSIGVKMSEKGVCLKIGRRDWALSTANNPAHRDYAPERFATVAVLSKLAAGEQIKAVKLWEQVRNMLGYDETAGDVDRLAMISIRSFVTGLTYRNQQIFQHNGKRGLGSAYNANPELKYAVELGIDDPQFSELLEQLLGAAQAHRQSRRQVAEADSALTPSGAAVAGQEPTPTEFLSITERIQQSELLPTDSELHSFLLKVSSTMAVVGSQIEEGRFEMLGNLYVLAEEMLDDIEAACPTGEPVIKTEAEIDAMRSNVIEKFIRIYADDELLNLLLEEEAQPVLKTTYGEHIGGKLTELIQTVLDMGDEEKDLLRQIILAKEASSIRMHAGSFKGGELILDSGRTVVLADGSTYSTRPEVQYASAGLAEEDEVEAPTTHHVERAVVETPLDHEAPAANLPEESELADSDDDEINLAAGLPPVVTEAIQQTEIAPPQEPTSRTEKNPRQRIRQIVGGQIAAVVERGMRADSRWTTSRLQAEFGTPVTHVVSAFENGWLDRNDKSSLNLAEVITVLILNSPDQEVKKLLQNNRNRRLLKSTIRSSIRAFEESQK